MRNCLVAETWTRTAEVQILYGFTKHFQRHVVFYSFDFPQHICYFWTWVETFLFLILVWGSSSAS